MKRTAAAAVVPRHHRHQPLFLSVLLLLALSWSLLVAADSSTCPLSVQLGHTKRTKKVKALNKVIRITAKLHSLDESSTINHAGVTFTLPPNIFFLDAKATDDNKKGWNAKKAATHKASSAGGYFQVNGSVDGTTSLFWYGLTLAPKKKYSFSARALVPSCYVGPSNVQIHATAWIHDLTTLTNDSLTCMPTFSNSQKLTILTPPKAEKREPTYKGSTYNCTIPNPNPENNPYYLYAFGQRCAEGVRLSPLSGAPDVNGPYISPADYCHDLGFTHYSGSVPFFFYVYRYPTFYDCYVCKECASIFDPAYVVRLLVVVCACVFMYMCLLGRPLF
jgi:hypothetical protein